MSETAKRCWPLHPHRWTRWQRTEGISYYSSGLQIPVDLQERHCIRCGRTQLVKVAK